MDMPPPPPALVTEAEQSGWKRTGRYAEALALCEAFEKAHPKRVKCAEFGRTPEGRPLVALAASDDGVLTPEEARAKGRPVVLFQGGIHAGEVDGKDAGFWLLRELLEGRAASGSLEKVTAVFVPVFSADGHERFGPNQRPNQNGPEETGWRVTAHNLNLNRDYVKAEAPEMKAMLALLNAWNPILYVDLHATDGAKFEHDLSVLVEPTNLGPDSLKAHGRNIRDRLGRALEERGHLPVMEFYPSFNKKDDPTSGFSVWAGPPRFSTSYWPLRNRFAVLVETHSWKDYATRVKGTKHVVQDLLAHAARDGKAWLRAAAEADRRDARGRDKTAVLAYAAGPKFRTVDFRGYAYTVERSSVSDQNWIRYDDKTPQVWKVPFYDQLVATTTVRLPKGGYLVPAAWAPLVAGKLDLHGLSYERLERAAELEVEAFRAEEVAYPAKSLEGRQTVALKGRWEEETQALPAGSLYVPAAQRGRMLLAHLLEPEGPDSLASWGYFNACWEQREYMEDYLTEAVAREMLEDKKVKKAFEDRLEEDPEFKKSPAKRLWFFYERHPSFDARWRLYPVFRTARRPS